MRAILHIGQRQLQKRQGERNAPVKYHTPNKRQLRSDYGVEVDVGVGLSSAGFEENDGDGVDEAIASLFLASSSNCFSSAYIFPSPAASMYSFAASAWLDSTSSNAT